MKSLLLLLAAALFSLPASAECTVVTISHSSANLYLGIDTHCVDRETISFTKKPVYEKGKDGGKYLTNADNLIEYQLREECTWKGQPGDDAMRSLLDWKILSCHPKGRTPLAGATYKLKAGTKYVKYDECGEKLKKPEKVKFWQYVCVSGCKKKGVPARLDVPWGYCD